MAVFRMEKTRDYRMSNLLAICGKIKKFTENGELLRILIKNVGPVCR